MTAHLGARVLAVNRHRIATLSIREHLLVVVVSGRKTLLGATARHVAAHGQAIAVAGGTQSDVINDPCGSGVYEATVLGFADDCVRACDDQLAGSDPAVAGEPSATAIVLDADADAELLDAVQRVGIDGQAGIASPTIRRHRMLEVLLVLAERGCRFRPLSELCWNERVRRLVAERPHAPWSVDDVATTLHLSASSLRCRLTGTSVGAIVREARLEVALELRQTTTLPIGEVAQRCGWDSHSRFSSAFQARWRFPPSLLRAGLTRRAQKLARSG